MATLGALLDRLEERFGPADPVPSRDGWHLVLAENIGYLVDDDRRWQAMANLAKSVRPAPQYILHAHDAPLPGVVAGSPVRPRTDRMRSCTPLAMSAAPSTPTPATGS